MQTYCWCEGCADLCDNIDLFPFGWLYERWCKIIQDDQYTIVTPKGHTVRVRQWGKLPYIKKEELNRILQDLPEPFVVGRKGKQCQKPRAALSCRVNTMSEIRGQLRYLRDDFSKEKLHNIQMKYRNLPDVYYGGETTKFVGPQEKLSDKSVVHGL